jgi:hypothetical protein
MRPAGARVPKTLKRKILRRQGGRCAACGRSEGNGVLLDPHHIVPVHAGGETTIENLVVLCRECHEREHVTMDGDVVVPGVGPVFVCASCRRGEHRSYGSDHRDGPEDSRDCKNLSPDGKRQCLCNPDWPELTAALAQKR